jgi:hypothetical protein
MSELSEFDHDFGVSSPAGGWVAIVPAPPSANDMTSFGKGRVYRSKAYKAWLGRCFFLTRGAITKVEGTVSIDIAIVGGKGLKANRDLDNFVKPIVDMCRHLGVIPEDNFSIVRSLRATYTPPANKTARARVTVMVFPDP